MANVVTGLRIVCSLVLLFCPAFTKPFYAVYIIAGITDMIDGEIARKTNTACNFGSKFDTVADIVFLSVCFVRIAPALNIPVWIWIWIAVIALIKTANIIYGFAVYRKFTAVHTTANKTAGLLLFALPLSLKYIEIRYSAIAVCTAATAAAVSEGIVQIKQKREGCSKKYPYTKNR